MPLKLASNLVQVECEFCEKTFLIENFEDDGRAGISCQKCFIEQFGEDVN